MFYQFVFCTAIENNIFNETLEHRFAWLKEKGYSLIMDTRINDAYNLSKLSISLQGNKTDGVFREEDVIYIFKHQISEVLAEHIISNWEEKIIWKEITRKYHRISLDDRNIIFNKSVSFLNRCNNNESLNLLINYGRKNKIAHKILEYIHDNDLLVIEGFVNFCLPEYLKEIRFAVDLAYEELKNEKEYNEFIKLLRYFVDTQPSKTFEVNLLMEDNKFYLWDGNGVKIDESYMTSYLDDILSDDISLDDVLISILITIAPRRIVIHEASRIDNSSPVEMIKNVFKDRIKVCRGCERCYLHKMEDYKPH